MIAEQRVEAEERREAEEHAERERGGGALRRVVDVEQRVQPAADQRLRSGESSEVD